MKKLLTLLSILTILLPLSLFGQKDSGLIGYYPFNGNTADLSGNLFHAINHGAELTTDRFGTANSAYYFDGLNDFMDLGDIMDFAFSGDNAQFAISLWFNFSENNMRQLVAKSATTTCGEEQRQFTLWTDNNHLKFSYNCSPTLAVYWSVQADKYLAANTWYHAVVNYNGKVYSSGLDRVTIYIDNEKMNTNILKSNGSLSYIKNGTAHLGIGNNLTSNGQSCSSNKFVGKIDDLRFYTRVLATNDITELNQINPLTLENDNTPDTRLSYLTNGNLELLFDKKEDRAISVFSLTGGEIITFPNSHGQSLLIDMARYPKGIYIIKVSDNQKSSIFKAVHF